MGLLSVAGRAGAARTPGGAGQASAASDAVLAIRSAADEAAGRLSAAAEAAAAQTRTAAEAAGAHISAAGAAVSAAAAAAAAAAVAAGSAAAAGAEAPSPRPMRHVGSGTALEMITEGQPQHLGLQRPSLRQASETQGQEPPPPSPSARTAALLSGQGALGWGMPEEWG